MNRLILIGNGFDLAHGLKTGYNEFILWYLKKCFAVAQGKKYFEDDLILIRKVPGIDIPEFLGSVEGFIDFYYKKGLSTLSNTTFKREGWQNIYDNPFEIKIKSALLYLMLSKCSYTQWVEIENDFYELLKDVFRSQSKDRDKDLLNLNASLAQILKIIYRSSNQASCITDTMRFLIHRF